MDQGSPGDEKNTLKEGVRGIIFTELGKGEWGFRGDGGGRVG